MSRLDETCILTHGSSSFDKRSKHSKVFQLDKKEVLIIPCSMFCCVSLLQVDCISYAQRSRLSGNLSNIES